MPPTAALQGAPRLPATSATRRVIPAGAMADLHLLAPWLH